MLGKLLLLICLATLLQACSTVKPWDRDLLAEGQMQLVPDPLDNVLSEHIYFSKEASYGGQGVGGGGCGCN